MRTKHLFYTAAMAALFAACVNDDFETIAGQQDAVNDGRPVAGNVKLDFTKGGGADTRLSYEGQQIGYQWEATDEIGALLMDNVIAEYPETESLTWLEKYKLVNDIHTSYRFTYDVNEKVWGCDAKMLEGNYFFAYPWESYDGERRVKHSLTEQSQEGVGAEIRRESYAKNQFFIGYSQIMAGTNDTEVLDSSVEMVPVLGAIQLQIVNTGTQTYHINKVVLKSDQLYSTLTFDPTKAAYGKNNKWNLEQNRLQGNVGWGTDATATTFNYANYTGNQEDIYYSKATTPAPVYNIAADDKYERNAALRAVVNQDPTETDNYAEIAITGTEEQRALVSTKVDEDAIAYVLIMANAVESVTKNGLKLDIYTDEGIVRNIDLTVKTTDNINNPGGQDKYEALVSSAVKAIGPSVVNTVGVQIDDNSFNVPTSMDIYTNDDLEQFIKWNVEETGNQEITAKLVKPNVTLSAEMAQLLADNSDVDLTITGNETLTLAEGVVSNLLDLENVHINCGIKVEGTLDLTEDSELNNIAIAVAEGATLNINEDLDSKAKTAITNEGVVEVAEKATVPATVTFINEAEMTIGADADVKGAITNKANATIDNAGYIADLTNDRAANDKEEDAVINLTGKSTIAAGTNNGIINAGKESRVMANVTNNGEIIMTELGAKISTGGTISYVTGDLKLDDTTLKSLSEAKVNKLILTGDVTVANEKEAASFTTIAAQDGSSLEVGEKALGLTVTNLNIEGDATTDGTIDATTVTVDEDITLTNYGTINSTNFVNNGNVNNHGAVNVENEVKGNGHWGYTEVNDNTGKLSDLQIAMNTLVKDWVETAKLTDYYNYDPNEVSLFAKSLAAWGTTRSEVATLNKKLKPASLDQVGWEKVLESEGAPISAFTTAVKTQILTETNVATIKAIVVNETTGALNYAPVNQDETNFENTQAEAYAPLYKFLANPTSISNKTSRLVAAAAWGISTKDLANAMAKSTGKTPYLYVWKNCTLDEAIDIWKNNVQLTGGSIQTNAFTAAFDNGSARDNILDYLVNWVKAVYNENPNIPAIKSVQEQLTTIGVTYANVSTLFGNSDEDGYTKNQMGLCEEIIK